MFWWLFDRKSDPYRELNREFVETQALSDYYDLRKRWSNVLIGFVSVMLLFQMYLTIAIGKGWLVFKDYQYLISLIVGENFLQIVSMCIMVVAFLFPKNNEKEK